MNLKKISAPKIPRGGGFLFISKSANVGGFEAGDYSS